MNIKQAELLSGISKRNIRFYEQEDLIHPTRNQENDYREYSEEDINTLKLIRALRMIDMPLEQIRAVIKGDTKLKDAAVEQKTKLQQQVKQLETAIYFCEEFYHSSSIQNMNIDDILTRMDAPANKVGLFQQWVNDYKRLVKAQSEKVFTFIPDDAVTNSREFTTALFAYANENNLNLVITKESMYPQFTIDGMEYTAQRIYTSVRGIPIAVIRCTAMHPELFEPDISTKKKLLLKIFHYSWLPLLFTIIVLGICGFHFFNSWESWLIFFSLLAVISAMVCHTEILFYNENGKK